MTDLSTLSSVASGAGTTAASSVSGAVGASSMSMNDFLKLMTTQLKAQDPFNPMDNTQMASQLAQYSSVAGIQQLNTTLSSIASEVSGSRVGDAASWIGKKALVSSPTATPLSDGSYAGTVTLPSAVSGMTVSLVDATGNVVHSQSYGAQAAGDVDFAWDGKDATGNVASGSPLRIVVAAKDASNAAVTPSQTASWAAIGGVQSPANGSTKLVTPLGTIDPTAALQLS
jgi:flagellar basal-body rod modification protein FlgD